jgi:hypothetical protein
MVGFIFDNTRLLSRHTRSVVRSLWLERDQTKAVFGFWSTAFQGYLGHSR